MYAHEDAARSVFRQSVCFVLAGATGNNFFGPSACAFFHLYLVFLERPIDFEMSIEQDFGDRFFALSKVHAFYVPPLNGVVDGKDQCPGRVYTSCVVAELAENEKGLL